MAPAEDALGYKLPHCHRHWLYRGICSMHGRIITNGLAKPRAIEGRARATISSTVTLGAVATNYIVDRSRKTIYPVVVVVKAQRELLQMVGTLAPPGSFPGGLHRGQQQRDQNPDDCNHDQQFHQRETSFTAEQSHDSLLH
jgi:hypothetical protein